MKFLKENAEVIREAIIEIFHSAVDNKEQMSARLFLYHYNELDCSDFSELVPNAPKMEEKYESGIQVIVVFNGIGIKDGPCFFYPEKEFSNMEDFIDNMNTDFGMIQVTKVHFQHLGISWYNLVDDMIQTGCPELGTVHKYKGFSECWDPKTLVFNERAFHKVVGTFKDVPKGHTVAFPVPIPVSIKDPQKMLGVDRKKFLAMVQEKQPHKAELSAREERLYEELRKSQEETKKMKAMFNAEKANNSELREELSDIERMLALLMQDAGIEQQRSRAGEYPGLFKQQSETTITQQTAGLQNECNSPCSKRE